MYAITIWSLVLFGFLMSSVYVLTWTPAAIKAKLRGHTRLKGWEIIDFAALPAACFLILGLSIFNLIAIGVQTPSTPGTAIQRVATTLFIDVIVTIRTIRWGLEYSAADSQDRASGAALTPGSTREPS